MSLAFLTDEPPAAQARLRQCSAWRARQCHGRPTRAWLQAGAAARYILSGGLREAD